MTDHFVVSLQQPNRSAVVHRVRSRYIVSQLIIPSNYSYSWIFGSRYVAIFSYGAVIQKDSVEEYEVLAKQGAEYPGFISWFKKTIISIRPFLFFG